MAGFQDRERGAQIGPADAKAFGKRAFRSKPLPRLELLLADEGADAVDQPVRRRRRAIRVNAIRHVHALSSVGFLQFYNFNVSSVFVNPSMNQSTSDSLKASGGRSLRMLP